MRLSPVLVAAIAASATLGVSHPASGQTSDSAAPGTEQLEVPSPASNFQNKEASKREATTPDPLLLNPHGILGAPTKAEALNFALGSHSAEVLPHKGIENWAPGMGHLSASAYPVASHQSPLGNPQFSVASHQSPTSHPQFSVASHHSPIPVSPPQSLAQASETPSSNETNEPIENAEPTPSEAAPLPVTPVQTNPETPLEPGTPPQGTPTPTQETPNQIQITPTPRQGGEIELNIPQQQPATPPTTSPGTQATPSQEAEPLVLVSEVVVSGVEGELQEIVYNAIRTQPGRTTTRSQLQEDINAIFATGYFAQVRVQPEDTPLGVRVTFLVEPNPVLRSVQVEGAQVVPQAVVNEIFSPQYGRTLNLKDLQEAVKRLNSWYQERGYVLAQVVDSKVAPDGTVTLTVAEGVIEDIQVRFLNKEGEATDDQGRPIQGRTRSYIIRREMALKPGAIFNRNEIQKDLQRIFRLGIFQDVQLSLNPGTDPRRVVVVVNVKERNTGSIAFGGGFSSASGLFGSVSYQQQNLGGNNQTGGAVVQLGQREFLFDLRFTDPWIGGDPYRTSYTVNFFRRRSISLIFDGGEKDVDLPNGDTPRIVRLGGGVTFNRPLSRNVFEDAQWQASLGLQYQRVSIRDADGELSPEDEKGNDLTASGEGKDDLVFLQFGISSDRRNDRLRPTSGSLLRLGIDQSVPVGLGSIFMTRLRGSYSYYIPVRFTNFTKGPQALAFNVQAGTTLFDLPPYEAFSLGGTNSVRGYDEGDVGSGRSFFQATAEYRFPIFSFIGGALFADFGSDLGTGKDVPGDPAGIRRKPGTGFGYGLGIRIQSPLGPIRLDYGINDQGDSRIHFGIGERF